MLCQAVQQFVRRGFDVMNGPVEFTICIDLFLSQEALKLEGKGLTKSSALEGYVGPCHFLTKNSALAGCAIP